MNPQQTDTLSAERIPDLLPHLRQIVRIVNRPDIHSVSVLLNRMLGNRNAATMCLHLLYWFPRATRAEGWVFKSWRDWQAECNLSQGQVKRVHRKRYLETIGIVRKTMKASGTPTMHYRLDLNRFVQCVAHSFDLPMNQIQGWMQDLGRCYNPSQLAETTASNGPKQPNGNGKNDPSHWAETTQSITTTTRQNHQHQDYQDNKQQRPDVVVDDSNPNDSDTVEEIRRDFEALGIQRVKARKLILEYSTKRIQAVIAHARRQTVHNPAGFVIRALEQGWQIMDSRADRTTDELEDGMSYVRGKYAEFYRLLRFLNRERWSWQNHSRTGFPYLGCLRWFFGSHARPGSGCLC
jgi:hypothetical protein